DSRATDLGRSLLCRSARPARPRAGRGAPGQRRGRPAAARRRAEPGRAAAAAGAGRGGALHTRGRHAGRLQHDLARPCRARGRAPGHAGGRPRARRGGPRQPGGGRPRRADGAWSNSISSERV
ncbi:MAG: hypothetical protein AVDCRST_MAG83-3753, partial [uncultured Arthrobacter sp.]